MPKFRPGVTFSDFVVTGFSKTRMKQLDYKPPRDFRRGVVIWVVCMMSLGFLWVRLFSLQVLSYDRYRTLSDENRLRLLKLPAPRGTIYDRDGNIMATNEKIFREESELKIEGYKRKYPETEVAVHVLGSLSEVSEKELGLLTETGKYTAGDLIGRSGLDEIYEKSLRGKNGGWLIEVDHTGKMIRDLGKTLPEPGQDLKTTLSLPLSRVADEALKGEKGAVVVANPQTGELLVVTSSPAYDGNKLVENFESLVKHPDLPLFNRAISATYPPGSVFKMAVTVAALDSGQIKSDFSIIDTGYIQIGPYRYNNWLFTKHGGTEGSVGFTRAILRSTDTFFYRVGEKLGPEIMGEYANKFGFGEKTGIDIGGEEKGLIPSVAWKKEVKGENWYTGNSFHFAIGQDDLLVTPLQVNLMTNILATGGKKCRPHLVSNAPSNPPLYQRGGRQEELCTNVEISQTALEIVKKGMIGACSPGGTAFPLFDWNEAAKSGLSHSAFANAALGTALPLVACKTGTAEYVAEDGRMRTHGWLTAYAPADNPEISVTVVVEGGGEGSNVAAPVVRKILAKYFNVEDKYPYDRIPQEVGE